MLKHGGVPERAVTLTKGSHPTAVKSKGFLVADLIQKV
jgi:hypothetical protein